MSCCFQAPRQWCWCFRPPILRYPVIIFFFSPHPPTQNRETYSMLNEQKGENLILMVSVWASAPHFFCVFLYTCLLFCFVLFFFFRWNNWNWNFSKTPLYSLWRFSSAHKKMKNTMIYWLQGQWGGVRARYCAPVHSWAVKWSRYTKWKMTADRLFTSRHQASFKMGLIASPCSWSWFKVLTSISWCPVCCRDMFYKDLSTATGSAATLSAVREIMYKEKLFSIRPAAYPLKSPTGPLQSTPHPPAQRAGLVPLVARGIVTGLTNWTTSMTVYLNQKPLFPG